MNYASINKISIKAQLFHRPYGQNQIEPLDLKSVASLKTSSLIAHTKMIDMNSLT